MSAPLRRLTGLVGLLVVIAATPALAQVTLSLDVEPQTVQVGDAVTVTIRLEGAGLSAPKPQLPNPANLELIGTSGGPSIQIINGQTTVTHQTGLTFRATGAGKVSIGPAKMTIRGQVFQSNTADVEVVDRMAAAAPGDVPEEAAGNAAFIDAEVEPASAYPGQEVIVTYYFYLIEGQGLEGAELLGDPAFTGGLGHRLSGGQSFNFTSTNVGGTRYKVSQVVRFAVYPIAPGEMKIEPLAMSVLLPERGRRRGDPFGIDSFFGRTVRRELRSPAKTIAVKPLPAAGRPAGFENNVGVFTMTAAIDKSQVRAGEGATVSITVTGKGNADSLGAPKLNLPTGLRGFKEASRDDSVASLDTMKARRVFETVIVPEKDGEYTLGPFSLDVFNPVKQAYETISAGPIALSVLPGDVAAAPARPRTKEEIALAGRDIRTVKSDAQHLDEWREPMTRHPAYWAVFLLTPVAFAVRAWRVRHAEHLAGNVALARRLRAGKEAKKHLAAANKAVGGAPSDFGAALTAALIGFVADQFAVEAPSLTAAAARERLAARGVGDDLLRDFADLLGGCDAMRFGGVNPPTDDRRAAIERAGRWIDAVHRLLAKGGAS
ncbi:MAG: BatD family protein [Deltaproteobacteria bacterium]|nr:BatD family protein [Deltaproteobacteria bacterium]